MTVCPRGPTMRCIPAGHVGACPTRSAATQKGSVYRIMDQTQMHSLTRQYAVQTANMDLTSSWKPSSLMEALQETAAQNSDLLGCGRLRLLEDGIVWVVLRMEVFMDRYPRLGESVSVLTYPKKPRHGMYPRYFVLTDEHEETIGRASSLWALLDLQTRKSIQSPRVMACIPDNPELAPCLPSLPPVVQVLDAEPEIGEHLPVYTDLDANTHVNNVRYIDWCCNALGIETMKDCALGHFVINFNREIVPGQTIRTEMRRDHGQFTFSGLEGDVRHFDIAGDLRPRI